MDSRYLKGIPHLGYQTKTQLVRLPQVLFPVIEVWYFTQFLLITVYIYRIYHGKGMKQTSQTKAKEICQHILKAYPNKSLEEFLDMVEYPAFLAKIPPQVIIEEAHIAYWNH